MNATSQGIIIIHNHGQKISHSAQACQSLRINPDAGKFNAHTIHTKNQKSARDTAKEFRKSSVSDFHPDCVFAGEPIFNFDLFLIPSGICLQLRTVHGGPSLLASFPGSRHQFLQGILS
jgi:hypothetical protein